MLTQERMTHLALLARLSLTPEASDKFRGQCDDILRYMDVLAEVDTSAIEPLYSPIAHDSAVREDIAVSRRSRAEVLSNAPHTDETFFIVPRIV